MEKAKIGGIYDLPEEIFSIQFFFFLLLFRSWEMMREYARTSRNDAAMTESMYNRLTLTTTFPNQSECADVFFFFMFSAVAEVTSVRANERNKMACAPHQFVRRATHMRFTTWSWFSQLPSECARHTGFFFFGLQFALAVCHSRDFYYTKSAHIIKSIKIRHLLSTFALFFYFLLLFFFFCSVRRISLVRRVQ